MKSLKARQSTLVNSETQLQQLQHGTERLAKLPLFSDKIHNVGWLPLRATETQIFQMNLGKMCNQVCKHCHVDAGPDRREIMTRETMEQCLTILAQNPSMKTVDLTGGAPEMNPNFRWFVEEVSKLGRTTMVRCNLTIILANKSYHDLPEFFAKNKVHVVSSLPFYEKTKTDKQRGDGVFEKSIRALQMLNEVGYGQENSGLKLDLVYNPNGAFLPGPQKALESDYKRQLKKDFNIVFNHLYTITNMPISRYLEYLIESDNLEDYMEKLVQSFNPSAVEGLMCRNTLSIGWDGFIYDCDFNQMLELKVAAPKSQHVKDYNSALLAERAVVVNQHCFGCTAGSGSSCGGQLT